MTITNAALAIGISVYVDNTAAGSNAALLGLATGFVGFWHAGWSPVSIAPWSSGTTNYLTGSLADMAEFPSALSAATVAGLAGSSSQAAWNSAITTAGATGSWSLGDSGTSAYTGTLPVVGATSACSFVDVAIGGTAFCVFPTSLTTACAAPASKLSTLAAGGPYSLPPIQSGLSVAIAIITARDSTYATTCATYCPGLHLLLPTTVTESLAGLSSALAFIASQTVI
jgi:hypothetical protein